jgi:5-formyltetrahydrofolate cyclo-ligase
LQTAVERIELRIAIVGGGVRACRLSIAFTAQTLRIALSFGNGDGRFSICIRAAGGGFLLPLEASGVALFWPLESDGEVDLRPLDTLLRQRGVKLYYPFMDEKPGGGFTTGFRRSLQADDLGPRGQRFMEPPQQAPTARPGDVDVVVVPALAVTPEGGRLGYGSGFYDVTLPDVCPPAVAVVVAFAFQLVIELPLSAHDVSCDAVVTDQHLFDPSGALQSP